MVDVFSLHKRRACTHEVLVRFEAFVAVALERCVKNLVDVRQSSSLITQPRLESAFEQGALSDAGDARS